MRAQLNGTRERRRRAGFCTECGQVPPITGMMRCRACQDHHNTWQAAYRDARLSQGLCRDCDLVAVPGETRCDYHKSKNAEYIARWRARRQARQLRVS